MKSIFRKSLCLLMVLCFVLFGLSFVKVNVKATTTGVTFTKITAAPTDWAAEYAIVYETKVSDVDTAYIWTGVDAVNGYESTTITNEAITCSPVYVKVEAMTGGYSIKIVGGTNNGKYIGMSSEANGLSFSSNKVVNNIEYDSTSKSVLISSSNSFLRFNKTSNQMRFRYYKSGSYSSQQAIQLYKKPASKTEELSIPTNLSISNNLISFDSVTNASGYKLGVFASAESTEPVKTYDLTSTSVTNPCTAKGSWYGKVMAVGDNNNYTDSKYTTQTIEFSNGVFEKTLAEVYAASVETSYPYTYYKFSGTVSSIESTDKASFYMTDGTNNVYVYDLLDSEAGESTTMTTLGVNVGDNITVVCYKKKYNNIDEFCGYYVSHSANFLAQFKLLETKASMRVDYSVNQTENAINLSEEFIGTASSDKTLPEGWAGTVGGTYNTPYWQSFRNNGENIISPAFAAKNEIEVSLKIYLNNTGNSGGKSSKIVITALNELGETITSYTSEELNSLKTGAANAKLLSTKLSGEGIVQVKIQLLKDGGGNIAFSNVAIYSPRTYSIEQENEKNILSLRFGTIFNKSLVDNISTLGTSIKYGVLYAKSSDLSNEKITMQSIAELLNDGDSLSDVITVYDFLKYTEINASSLVGVDATGMNIVTENPEYYQFGVSINNIPTANITTEITAVTYVNIDGVYTLSIQKVYSVKSIAQAYLDASNTTNYTQHLSALKWLSELD